jgi:hypothetical protein
VNCAGIPKPLLGAGGCEDDGKGSEEPEVIGGDIGGDGGVMLCGINGIG